MGFLDLRLPYLARAIALAASFLFLLFFMKENGFTPRGKLRTLYNESETYNESFNRIWMESKVLKIIHDHILFSISLYDVGILCISAVFTRFTGNPEAVWISGLVVACVALAQIFGNSLVSPLIKRVGKRTTILTIAGAFAAISTLGIGLSGNFIAAFLCILFLMAAIGLFMPIKQGYMHQLIPKEQRATVLSFDSLVGNGGGIIGLPGLGYIPKSLVSDYNSSAQFFTSNLLVEYRSHLPRRSLEISRSC